MMGEIIIKSDGDEMSTKKNITLGNTTITSFKGLPVAVHNRSYEVAGEELGSYEAKDRH